MPKAPERILLIKAKGGLGNRMLSAICGLVFADLSGRRAVIDWQDGSYGPPGENAYHLLFDSPLKDETFDDYVGPVTPAIWQGHLGEQMAPMVSRHAPDQHSSARVYRRFCTDLSRLDAPEDMAVFWCYLPKFRRLAAHMRRDPRFAGKSIDTVIGEYLQRYFTPNSRVRQAVAKQLEQVKRPLIGVHVRYTDRKVPVDKIEAALETALQKNPGASVFLATDNAEIQTRFAAQIDNLHVIDKYLPPDGSLLHWPNTQLEKTREAENALIDMQLLSHSDYLVCSRHSTFSETAILYGGLRGRVKDIDQFNPVVVSKRLVQEFA